MSTNSITPATKPQPVVIYGAVLAALVFVNGGLIAQFNDNAQVMLWLGIVNILLGGASVLKDQIVKGMVVPLQDSAAYLNDDRELIAGPAADVRDGDAVEVTRAGNPQEGAPNEPSDL